MRGERMKPKEYADTRDMTRDQWLAARRGGIGGSDASAILGVNPYTTPLAVYMDKIGKGREDAPNEAMRQGTDLEEYVAQRFTEETGHKVRRCRKILQHPDYPWMLANVDRLVVGQQWGLECKTTSPFSKFKFDEGEINPHYYWQSVHYMAVTGFKMWFVAILVLGKAFHVFRIERDENAIAQLIAAEKDFWENHVMTKVPPLPTGSDADDDAIGDLFSQATIGGEEYADLSGVEDMLNLRDFKARQKNALEEEIKQIDQSIKLAMGKFERGVSATWRVNWTNTTSSRVDTKALQAKYPKIAAEMTKTTQGRRFSVNRIKEDE